jgi:hypothetical protein
LTTEITSTADSVSDGWFKSSRSNAGGSCVEARFTPDTTLVRDSKDRRSDSPFIEFQPTAWSAFLHVVKPEDV